MFADIVLPLIYRLLDRLVVVPSSMIPKRALSALFNIPTLLAYEDGCDYFYIGNDDLQFKSQGWTELLVDPLLNNPVYSGLGVSGGIDISDSITPQIEFPFFHRTHVSYCCYFCCWLGNQDMISFVYLIRWNYFLGVELILGFSRIGV